MVLKAGIWAELCHLNVPTRIYCWVSPESWKLLLKTRKHSDLQHLPLWTLPVPVFFYTFSLFSFARRHFSTNSSNRRWFELRAETLLWHLDKLLLWQEITVVAPENRFNQTTSCQHVPSITRGTSGSAPWKAASEARNPHGQENKTKLFKSHKNAAHVQCV